jgi:anaerobic dimethyl sulfoxide reductase subunit B (iron-sulfur subunit)
MKQYSFSFDVNRCSGCMSCIVACLDENDLPGDSPSFRHVTQMEKGQYPFVGISFFSISCLHCGDAPCLMVCPTGAISKRDKDGVVEVNQDLCIGCHSCALACPFGAPQFPEGVRMSKCHFCIDRVEHDLEPACVRVCPGKAIGFGPVDELAEQKAHKASIALLTSLPTGSGLKPT